LHELVLPAAGITGEIMEQLDLRRHTPEEFAGKSVTIGARNYTIGAKLPGDEGNAHFHFNELSGLCLHIVRIGEEYLSNPSGARETSRKRALEAASLRANMLRNGEPVTLPFISVIEGNCGSFELHETTWGAFGRTEDSPGREAFDLALSQSQAGDHRSAVAVLTALLEKHPNHSVALGFLGGVLCDIKEQDSAEQMCARSIEIEPNYAKFRGQQIIVALGNGAIWRRRALELFQELKARYPLLTDYDSFGIQANVLCGEPQQALNLLQQNTLPKPDAEQWLTQITYALQLKQQLLELGEAVEKSLLEDTDLLEILEALFKAYPADPMIQANLGSALYRAGQYRRAAALLLSASGGIADNLDIYCVVNLAFATLQMSAWEQAMDMFSSIIDRVSSKLGHCAKVSPSDVPGLGDWFADKGVLKSTHNSNYELLDAAIAACPDRALITPQVRQLAELYRQAAGLPKPAIVASPRAASPAAAPANLPASTAIPAAPTVELMNTAAPPSNASVAQPETAAAPISNVSSMAGPHVAHTATLLLNGKVLIAGGGGNPRDELYDAASGTWSPAGSLVTSRAYHTATLLPGGKVLVAGGTGAGQELSGAELYDPSSDTWSATGSLEMHRERHTATLLPSGKVLVAGGRGRGRMVFSAELYDPSSNAWSSAAKLAKGRYHHSATLLPSGKVLVAGGWGGSPYLSGAELYDPSSDSWSDAGSLATARQGHTATLLPCGKVLVVGGQNGCPHYVANAELYDPSSNTWSSAGNLAKARDLHTDTLLPSGKVLVAGGRGVRAGLVGAELYDPSSNSWSSAGSVATAREEHTATLLPSGKVPPRVMLVVASK
jgi:tetratricopeptide (TPR) repeat protein